MAITNTALQRFILCALAIILAVVVVAVSVYFANADRKGARPGDVSSVIEQPPDVLNTTTAVNLVPGYSFNVNDNLAICNRKVVRVPLTFDIDADVDDFSPAINKAVADISRDGGGSVMLDEGVYHLSTPIFPKNNTCIRGAGMLKTLLRMNPNSPPFYRAGMLRIVNASRISIHDLTLDGSRATQNNSTQEYRYGRYGVYATQFKYLWLRGIRAVNHREYGFDPHGTRTTWSHYLVIESCDASENGLDGFTIDQTEHVSLLKSTARHNYRHGVNIVTGSHDVLVRDVTADYNGASDPDSRGCGFIAQNNVPELQTQDIKIVTSSFSESPRGAVCISDSVNVSLSNVNATITRFLTAPCFVLRQARQVNFSQATCTARSGRRISNIESMYVDDMQGQSVHWRPTNPLEFSNQQHLNTWVPGTDPVCSYGMSHKNICCPYDCDVCGKPGCGVYGQADRCCMDKILKGKKSCSEHTAPCVIKPKYMPLPDVFIDIPFALAPGQKAEEQTEEPVSPQEEEIDASALPPGGQAKPIDRDAGKRSNDTMIVELPEKNDTAVSVSEDGEENRSNRTIYIDLSGDNDAEENDTAVSSDSNSVNITTIILPLLDEEDSEKDENGDDEEGSKKDDKDDPKKDEKEDSESFTKFPSATDPVCGFGISYKNVCCPYECSVCGKEDCGKKGQGHYCCMESIVKTRGSCSNSTAPCVVDEQYLPLPKGKNATNWKIYKEYMKDEEDSAGNNETENDIASSEMADPLCEKGTSFKDVCCAKDCKVCGTEGCGQGGQGGRCCQSEILKSKKSCAEFSAPCVFEPKDKDKDDKEDIKFRPGDLPASDPTCKWGTKHKNVCCPYDCRDTCGKVGCGVDGQAGRCCVDGIVESNKSCSANVAPCIIEPESAERRNVTVAVDVDVNLKGDPVCDKGIVYKNVCCPKDCEVCSKEGCGVDGLAGRCCMDSIRDSDESCNENESPCVLDEKYLPLPNGEKNTLFENVFYANGTYTDTSQKEKIVATFVNGLSKEDKEAEGKTTLEFGLDSDGKLKDGKEFDTEDKVVYVGGNNEE